MPATSLHLYVDDQFISPYALSAFVGLTEKAIPFELHTLNLAAGAQRAPGYAQLSLTQRVPTLVQGEFSLSESSAITEYLDDVFPGQPLYPEAPRQRALARQLQAWLRSDLSALRQERSTLVVFKGQRGAPLSTDAQAAANKLLAGAARVLGGQEYAFGAWSIVDVDLALMLNRLLLAGDPVPEALAAYATRQWQRPSVQAWLAKA